MKHRIYWGCLPLRTASIEVVFHWVFLPFRLSSIEVVFHWSCLPFRWSSIEVVYHWGCLPIWSSSIEDVFHWSHLPLRLSSFEVVFHWGCLSLRLSYWCLVCMYIKLKFQVSVLSLVGGGWVGVGGWVDYKANFNQSWIWSLAELGNYAGPGLLSWFILSNGGHCSFPTATFCPSGY